jgi:nitroreductase
MDINKNDLKTTILQSQHCQRNWNLSLQIPKEDMDVIITAATQCPSKQNVAYYNIHAITDRAIIEEIHASTDGFTTHVNPYKSTTNSQALANLLIVLEAIDVSTINRHDRRDALETDSSIAIGIAAGYINLTAAMLGYYTGFCACFSREKVNEILKLKNEAILLLGIGFKDDALDRKIQHDNHEYMYPAKQKQKINEYYWK